MEGKCLEEFEKLNTTSESIYDLAGHKVLIVLKDGENLTSWEDVRNRNDVIYISEDLSDYKNLSEKYAGMESLRAVVATGISGNVKSMRGMFRGCRSLRDISCLAEWDVSAITDMAFMFLDCFKLKDLTPLSDWNVAAVENMAMMFNSCYSLSNLEGLDLWDVSNVRDMRELFGVNVIGYLFGGCGNQIADLSPISGWDVSGVENMWGMFRGCSVLSSLAPLAKWDVSNVSDMSFMFARCSSLVDLSGLEGWDISNVRDMGYMFSECRNLANLDALSDWNVSGDAFIRDIFRDCSSLVDASALNSWDVTRHNVNGLFEGCSALKVLPDWVYRPGKNRPFHPFGDIFRRHQNRENRSDGFED